MRYDAAIIGAGADGLAAGALLARAGLRVVIAERSLQPGGRCITREFHPGFFASPFVDEVAPVPDDIFRALDLARRGAIFAPAPATPLKREGAARAAALRARILKDAYAPRRRFFAPVSAPWPRNDWAARSLDEVVGEAATDSARYDRPAALVAGADALTGRSVDPGLAGSALQLLSPGAGGSGPVRGGLGALGEALAGAAREAGAELRLGIEASEIVREKNAVRGIALADGSRIEAGAVISTLDLKRTFLSLFKWSDLPPPLLARIGGFRMGGGVARLLVALGRRPVLGAGEMLYLAQESRAAALAAARGGAIPERLPLSLRIVSAADPSLAPAGAAVLTATLGCIPCRLFDGAWTHEKREGLRDRALALIEAALPGTLETMIAFETIVPPDIEEALGLSEGDLGGGELAPDQMSALRPGPGFGGGRTPLARLYLAGPSAAGGPLGTCFAGAVAAAALLTDRS